jgi:cytochrome c peroxidase
VASQFLSVRHADHFPKRRISMARLGVVTSLLLLGAIVFAAATPSSLPRDTLPARLPVKEVPLGLETRPLPKDNPLTAARAKLGRKLFFDPILSKDKSVACSSCHRPNHGFASREPRPRGIGSKPVARRAPTLFNRAYGKSFFWDGRMGSLEEQALSPIENPAEMGLPINEAIERLQANKEYQIQFARAFDDGLTKANLARAIACFEASFCAATAVLTVFAARASTTH